MGLDAAILGMVNQVLQKPTGGVDWSLLTPYRGEGEIVNLYVPASSTPTTVFSFSGSGFLTHFFIYARKQYSSDNYVGIQLWMDGTLITFFTTPESYSTDLEAYREGGTIWHFNNSLEIKVGSLYAVHLTPLRWGLDMSLE